MRLIALAAIAAFAGSAAAAPLPPVSEVHVTIGPELQKKAARKYGVREVERLAAELERTVARRLVTPGAAGRLDLVLVDAQPNRPTFKQMSDRPGLSWESFGVGGAKIEGQAVAADGSVTPVGYSWYETDITQVWPTTTWSDAQTTFSRFAYRLQRGQVLASR